MLTKIVTAALGLIVALMLLRFLSGRAHRAELRLRAEARRRREEEADAEALRQAEHRPEHKPSMVTLEVDPDGVYRPKG
jgi:hypothetical protein